MENMRRHFGENDRKQADDIQDMKKNEFQPCSFTQKTVNVSYEYQNLPEIQKSFLDQLPI